MRLALRIALFLLLLPAAEFLVFLLVAWEIGFLPALGLMLLTSLAGALVLRRVNRGGFGEFRRVLRDRKVSAGTTQAGGLLVAFAGILLLLPGFITISWAPGCSSRRSAAGSARPLARPCGERGKPPAKPPKRPPDRP